MEFAKEDEIIFEKFFQLKEKRQFKRALKVLDFLESKYKNSSVIYGLYGSIFFELEDFKNSAINFKEVITLKPKSELASIGLYVSLIHLGKHTKALKELFRYTEISEPKLYIVSIKELMEDNIDGMGSKKYKEKIQKLYKKWVISKPKSRKEI